MTEGSYHGYYIICPFCRNRVEDFSLADEWFCDCGEQGIIEWDDDEDEEDDPEGEL